MNDDSLTKIKTFHGELAALSATGLPLDLGMNEPEALLSSRLDRIYAGLAARLRRGQSVEQALAEEPDLPSQYRIALVTWLRCDDPSVALDRVTTPAVARRQVGMSLGQSMVYPLIVLTLSYFAFLYLCIITAPKIESMYAQLAHAPSHSLAFLIASRNMMPVWVPLLPLLLVFAVVWWRSRSKRASWAWVPGSSRYINAIQNANIAQQLARLTESGLSIQESLPLVGPLSGTAKVNSAGSVDSLPSLLRWAVSGDMGGEPAPRVLQLVSQTYRNQAKRQSAVWRITAPTICGVLLGGTFVLGYCLSMFLPLVQLLRDVSLPGGA
jgi:type II secretory pathway component PulF